MKYVADDGTVFNTEQECKDHEDKCAQIAEYVTFYSDELLEISMCDAVNYFDAVTYIYVKSNPLDVANYIGEDLGYEAREIYAPGVYKFNAEGVLFNIDDLIYEYTMTAQELERERNSIYQDQGISIETEGKSDE